MFTIFIMHMPNLHNGSTPKLYTFQEADLFFIYFKDELERFPLAQVHEPTAVLKNDRRETYNNLILFTVIDDPRRKNSPSDMHIFQSVNAPVSRKTAG